MESREDDRTPRPVEGVDMRALPIGPEEAFVLTRVDGVCGESDIAAATGLDLGRVRDSLRRLAELGAVRFGGPAPATEPPKPDASSATPGGRLSHPAIEAPPTEHASDGHPAAALYDPGELDEEIDIDLPRKRKILDYFYRLDTATHYELLGVSTDADRKAIRDSYFEIVGLFHPDKYFGKNLGSFKTKLERVFQRLTEASDVLSRQPTRDEYDAYLVTLGRTKSVERAIDGESAAEQVEEARRQIEREARLSERVSQAPPPMASWPPADPEARKRALARKLRGSIAPDRRPSGTAQPAVSRAQIQEHVADELKKRYEARLAQARNGQVSKYVAAGEAALAGKDLVSAANALRIASQLAPDDAVLKARAEEIAQQASAGLADTYLEQARYEEQSRHYLEAAASYEKATRGKPSAALYDRVASCLYQGGGDLRKAGDMARKALSLSPKSVEPRVTLAKIYLRVGMKESALAEFERAAQAAPQDDSIKDWIKRIKRGEV